MAEEKTSSFDLSRFPPPPMTSSAELGEKIAHLRGILEREGHDTILFSSEGAVRWLTGTRHQITDIAPKADSPIQALVQVRPSSIWLTFRTARTEMPRLLDQLPTLFDHVPGVELDFRESLPPLPDGALAPGRPGYDDVLGANCPTAGSSSQNEVTAPIGEPMVALRSEECSVELYTKEAVTRKSIGDARRLEGLDMHGDTTAVPVAEKDGEVQSLGIIFNRLTAPQHSLSRVDSWS